MDFSIDWMLLDSLDAPGTTIFSEDEFIFVKAPKASRCSEELNLNTVSQDHHHDLAEASA